MNLLRLFLFLLFLLPAFGICAQSNDAGAANWIPSIADYRSRMLVQHPGAPHELKELLEKWDRLQVPMQERYDVALNVTVAAEIYGDGYREVHRKLSKHFPNSVIASSFTERDLEILKRNGALIDLVLLGVLVMKFPFVIDPETDFLSELRYYNIQPGQSLAEIGAGTGAFGILLHYIYPGNKIYLNEINGAYLQFIGKHLTATGTVSPPEIVQLVKGSKRSARLPEPVDKVIVRNSFHHFGQPEDMLHSIGEMMKPEGRLYLLEEFADAAETDPTCSDLLSETKLEEYLFKSGFQIESKVRMGHRYLIECVR